MAAAVDKAYLAIRQGIITGDHAPGAHLTAQDLAAANGLSRTPVREAMRRLHAEGLIEFIAHRGAYVTRIDEAEITNIYDLRVMLESYAAASAAQRITAPQLSELRALADEMQDLVGEKSETPIERISEINNSFHKLVVQASHNSRLQSTLSSIVEMPLVLRTFRRYTIEQLTRSANQHSELVTALSSRDADWARSVMTSHILSARHTLLEQAQEALNGR
jgi:DNA-binding GntR family transcriptional regulator